MPTCNKLPTNMETLKYITEDILDNVRGFSEQQFNSTVDIEHMNGMLGTFTFVGNHEDAVKLMKTKNKTDKVIKIFKPVFGESCFNQQSDKWEESRRRFPFELLPDGWFTKQMPIFRYVIHKVCKKYCYARNRCYNKFNLLDFSRELVVSIKMKMTFGIDLDCNLLKYMNYQQNDIDRQLKFNLPPLSPFYFYGKYMWNKAIYRYGSRNKPITGSDDILSYLLKKGIIIDRPMKDEFNAIFWGGITSFVSTVCTALYHIKRDPEQERLIKESGNYEAAFKETLRMYPGAPLVVRKLKDEIELSGCKMGCGKKVIFCPYISQNDKRDWDNPTKFDFRRHIGHDGEVFYKGFMPFGVIKDLGIGGRRCTGYKFVMVVGPLILKVLLEQYDLQIDFPDSKFEIKSFAASYVPVKNIYGSIS